MASAFRFLDLPYLAPSENMAIDEALIENFQKDDLPIFRIYAWEKDAFSIGRFQKPREIENFQNFGENFTRRITGGGLLLHGFDISYSVILPLNFFGKKSVKQSYEYLCKFLLLFYKELGLAPYFAKERIKNSSETSAFCQSGLEPYDILIAGKKVGGNAQKRTKNFIYQHGSIALHVDSRPYSSVSLEDFGLNISQKQAKELLVASFTSTFDAKLFKIELTHTEEKSFKALQANKYKTKEWRYDKQA